MIDQTTLKSALSYCPETGIFTWASARPRIIVGAVAGYLKKNKGYIYIEIDGRSYSAHRLAFLYMTGEIPSGPVDHINRIKSDNRFSNLRISSHGQNRANSRANNKHGLKGISRLSWMKEGDRCWQAQITHNKKVKYLGCFHTKEEAHAAYAIAARELHGEFANP